MPETLSERVKNLLEAKSISQKEISGELGVEYTTLWRRLKGERKITVDFLQLLAGSLGTSSAYLLGETDDPSPNLGLPARQEEGSSPRVSQTTLDLEEIIKDLVYEHPDLAIGFRDTRENWKTLPDEDKQSIADALLSVFRPDPSRPTRLREKGRKGQV
nr:MAG TPA: helix-turn-helix domain protein [Caudoviricetes sp.]